MAGLPIGHISASETEPVTNAISSSMYHNQGVRVPCESLSGQRSHSGSAQGRKGSQHVAGCSDDCEFQAPSQGVFASSQMGTRGPLFSREESIVGIRNVVEQSWAL